MGFQRSMTLAIAAFTAAAVLVQTSGATASPNPHPGVAAAIDDLSQALRDRGETSLGVSGGQSVATLPGAGSGAVKATARGRTITMGMPANGPDMVPRQDAIAFFKGTGEDTSVAIQPTDEGMRALVHIDSADAPERFDFTMGGDIAALRLDPHGGVEALDRSGDVIATAPSPWAVDAQGTSVPTRYEIRGKRLTQVVDHRGRNVAYPVVADPDWHWWGISFKLSHAQAQKLAWALATTTSAAGLTAAICGGTIAGAIPCGIGYAVIAAVNGLASSTIYYCDRYSKGINLEYHWAGGYASCSGR